jgi:hypothetical protein
MIGKWSMNFNEDSIPFTRSIDNEALTTYVAGM